MMLSEMELGDGEGSDGGSAHEEEGAEETSTANEYQESGHRRDGTGTGSSGTYMSNFAQWADVTRLGADINRRIETHT